MASRAVMFSIITFMIVYEIINVTTLFTVIFIVILFNVPKEACDLKNLTKTYHFSIINFHCFSFVLQFEFNLVTIKVKNWLFV